MPNAVAKSMSRVASSFYEDNSKVIYSKTHNPKHINFTYCVMCFRRVMRRGKAIVTG
jgi:hypothetical protein